MRFCSTRDSSIRITGTEAIVGGIALDGGLYVPVDMPIFSKAKLCELAKLSYPELAAVLLKKFLPEIGYSELLSACQQAYSKEKFGDDAPVRMTNLLGRQSVLELWHGPTHAFKDMALQLLPHLMRLSLKATGVKKKPLILVATSGDTGKAALEGFSNVEGTKVAVFYPAGGVSEVQRLQMATHEAENTSVFAIKGNFDDTQSGVKAIFASKEMQKQANDAGWLLASANSINMGRLLPQVVYYFYAYFRMLKDKAIKPNESFDICVPTGNFGNILAGWYAYKMGLPISGFICASNKNNVLSDFLHTGEYSRNRQFMKTLSPSMDILISSNLERLLFEIVGRDSKMCDTLMTSLMSKGEYKVPTALGKQVFSRFSGRWVDDEQTLSTIKELFDRYGYGIDTHTAVAFKALFEERTANPVKCERQALVVSTASPFKFASSVLKGLEGDLDADEFKNLEKLSELLDMKVPQNLTELKQKPVRFTESYEKSEMSRLVLEVMKQG